MKKYDKAINHYIKGKVSIGKAAELAKMSTSDFKELLDKRNIIRQIKSSKQRVKKGIKILKNKLNLK